MNDEQLRATYSRLLESRSPRNGCPAPEALLAALRHEGAETARLEVFDHAAACAQCLRDLELLRTLHDAGRRDQRISLGKRWRTGVSLALAAAAVIALSLGPPLHTSGRQSDTPRGGPSPVTLVAPRDGADATAPSVTFTWRRVPTARLYTLEVVSKDGAMVWRTQSPDTTVAVIRALGQGEYRWWVRAQTDDGAELRSIARLLHVRIP